MHSKFMLVDGAWGMISSANLDIRSLRLDFEAGVLLHTPALITEIDVPVRSRLCSVFVALTTTVSRLSPGAGWAARTAKGISDVLKRKNRKI